HDAGAPAHRGRSNEAGRLRRQEARAEGRLCRGLVGADQQRRIRVRPLDRQARRWPAVGLTSQGDSIMFRSDKYEMTRRDLLKLSAAGVLGASVSGWFGVLAGRAAEAAKQGAKHKSCILLWMNGGPAQSHTFDLKDGSEYKAIPTSVPGIQISEHL